MLVSVGAWVRCSYDVTNLTLLISVILGVVIVHVCRVWFEFYLFG